MSKRMLIGLVLPLLLALPATAQSVDWAWSATLMRSDGAGGTCTYNQTSFSGRNYSRTTACTGIGPALADVVKTLEFTAKASSTSSHSYTVGSKTFSMVGGFGLYVGAAVRVAESSTEWLDGLVTAVDLSAQTVTVNVTGVTGSGSNASWTIGLGSASTSMASSPATIAQGGTGATTAAGARTNLELQRFFSVTSVLSTPPGSPADQQRHIVGASPTGAWVGQEHKIATFTTGFGWAFTTPSTGDAAYDIAANDAYIYTGVGQPAEGIYANSFWKELTPQRQRWLIAGSVVTTSQSITSANHNQWRVYGPSSPITITLPVVSGSPSVYGMEFIAEVISGSTASTTFVISGGSNIRLADGTLAASIVVNSGVYRRIHFVAGQFGTTSTENSWYVWGDG
jgi:hypothetical protein